MAPVIESSPPTRRVASPQDVPWSLLFLLGVMLALVGFVDIGTLLFPGQWTSAEWEFATITGLFDGLPLGTLGLGLMLVAAMAGGWRRVHRVLAVVLMVISLVLVGPLVLYLLDSAIAYRAANADLRPVLVKAVGKTVLMAVIYIVGYATLGVMSWRRLRISAKGA